VAEGEDAAAALVGGRCLPWLCGSEGRRAAVARLLHALVGSAGLPGHAHVASALLSVEAADVAGLQAALAREQRAQAQGGGVPLPLPAPRVAAVWASHQCGATPRAMAAAQKLLEARRDDTGLAAALGAMQVRCCRFLRFYTYAPGGPRRWHELRP
jgi:hypothetical protein